MQAEVATPGTADSFLKASHVSRTRHAHPVTASALHYWWTRYNSATGNRVFTKESIFSCLVFGANNNKLKVHITTTGLLPWSLSSRIWYSWGHCVKETSSCAKKLAQHLLPWCFFFALNHTNYARWLPVHIRDMEFLDKENPSIAVEFRNEYFVVQKTYRISSLTRHINRTTKLPKVTVWPKTHPSYCVWTYLWVQTFHGSWMDSIPPKSQRIKERVKDQISVTTSKWVGSRRFPQESKIGMQYYRRNGKTLSGEERGSSCAGHTWHHGLQCCRKCKAGRGNRQRAVPNVCHWEIWETHIPFWSNKEKQVVTFPVALHHLKPNPVTKCRWHHLRVTVFSFTPVSVMPNSWWQFEKILLSRESELVCACLVSIWKTQIWYEVRLGIPCLERLSPVQVYAPSVEALLLDGAAIVNTLKPGPSWTFGEYSQSIILPRVKSHLKNVQRVDVVWDTYIRDSFKAATSSKRGKGIRRRVKLDTKIPSNWLTFLELRLMRIRNNSLTILLRN